ncbi:hypothetical protein NE237_025620 [Protea cynaroides]|uniref:BHLH domain-containing protein n=1 Tax=Protea cynaroides TaxID=273540 RepID=A0A9Q0H7E5_9MAGN|nr:hypothetical protein NE237_025620 [Protea cynaroides]
MDSVFFMDEEARARFLRSLAQSACCTYVCLWYYYPPPSNYLIFMDGLYNDQSDLQPRSSFGCLDRKFFDCYRQCVYSIDKGYVPGLAFKEGLPYLELKELELLNRVSTVTQRQFYQEARIKVRLTLIHIHQHVYIPPFIYSGSHILWTSAAFMGCRSGEIEIGYKGPTEHNLEMEMKRWFPDDFYLQSQHKELPPAPKQNRPSSSSSSLKSLSMCSSPSTEYSSLLFNIPSTSNMPISLREASVEQPTKHKQQYHGLYQAPYPNPESDDAAMTRAILAVISSPSTSSSSYQTQQNPPHQNQVSHRTSAFKSYNPVLASKFQTKATSLHRQSMLKQAISFLHNMRLKKLQEQMQGTPRNSISTQLTHMISERKRREKLNESFQALKSLLPPGSKKDKASVLSSTRNYLQTLKAEISELKQKNQLMESRWFSSANKEAEKEVSGSSSTCSSTARVEIQLIQAAESTSDGQGIDLKVSVKGDCKMLDLVIRILEFLRKVDMEFLSVEADTQLQQTTTLNQVIIRLNNKGSEWDELAFREAIARIVADVTR